MEDVQEDVIEEIIHTELREETKLPDPNDATKDGNGPSTKDRVKGLLQTKTIQIPNDPILREVMKETKMDFNDYTKEFFLVLISYFKKYKDLKSTSSTNCKNISKPTWKQ